MTLDEKSVVTKLSTFFPTPFPFMKCYIISQNVDISERPLVAYHQL